MGEFVRQKMQSDFRSPLHHLACVLLEPRIASNYVSVIRRSFAYRGESQNDFQ